RVNSPGSIAVASPTGTVNFYDGSTWIRSGSLTTTAGVTTASFSTYTLAVGSNSITASYADDSNFNPSTSAPVTKVVSKADTTTSQASSVNPTRFGQSSTTTSPVSVISPGTTLVASPTGTVNFFDGGSTTPFGSGTLSTTSAGVTTA